VDLVQSRARNAFGGIVSRMDGPGILSRVVAGEIQRPQIVPAWESLRSTTESRLV
jgi:hypothetical protein